MTDCENNQVFRINPRTAAIVARITLPFYAPAEESSIAAGEGAVFVQGASGDATIARIDPKTNTVTGTFAAGRINAMRAGYGALWLTVGDPTSVSHRDPITGHRDAIIEIPAGAGFLALGEGSVWVLGTDPGVVTRVDPDTDVVEATINVSDGPVSGGDIAVGGGYVWARISDALVAQIDPATNLVVRRWGPPARKRQRCCRRRRRVGVRA